MRFKITMYILIKLMKKLNYQQRDDAFILLYSEFNEDDVAHFDQVKNNGANKL